MPAKRPVYQTRFRDVAPKVRLAQKTALSRSQRADNARLDLEYLIPPNEKAKWRTEYILSRNLEGFQEPMVQGGRRSRRSRRSRKRR